MSQNSNRARNHASARGIIGRPVVGLALCVILTWSFTPSEASAAPTTTTVPSPSSISLESFNFSSPATGFGVFTREVLNVQRCTDYVGRSDDGGAEFTSLVKVVTWNCASDSFTSQLAIDGRGDDFLYGPQLFVSHNDTKTWSRSPQPGSVLDVDAVGSSVWIVISTCTAAQRLAASPCPVRLRTSSDGGRSWATSRARPSGASTGITSGANGQSYLLRVSRTKAYLMLSPSSGTKRASSVAPLWFTSDGGVTWSNRQVPCHIGAWSAVLAAAPNGTLMAACASEPSAGSQIKSVLESVDGGRTWALKTRSDIDIGYLGALDLVSAREAFLVGGRSSLMVTHDGGSIWRAVEPLIGGSAGGTNEVVFFDASHGLVLGNDDNDNERLTLWRTDDGGAHWRTEPTRVAGVD